MPRPKEPATTKVRVDARYASYLSRAARRARLSLTAYTRRLAERQEAIRRRKVERRRRELFGQ